MSLFKQGNIRIIITTSVLEEGIDVSDCDIVIRFMGLSNLIQFIQSKGRARKENSKFIVLSN